MQAKVLLIEDHADIRRRRRWALEDSAPTLIVILTTDAAQQTKAKLLALTEVLPKAGPKPEAPVEREKKWLP